MDEIINQFLLECLAFKKKSNPNIPRAELAEGARLLTSSVVKGVREVLANPPTSLSPRPAPLRELSGISPDRAALLQQTAAAIAQRGAEKSAELTGKLRQNVEESARKFCDGLGVSQGTINTLIESVKQEAGW